MRLFVQHPSRRPSGVDFGDLADMRWASGVGQDNLLVTFDADNRMRITPRLAEFTARSIAFRAGLVVVDTGADTFGGNENDRSQVRQFIGNALNNLARQIDGAVLLNVHPSRSGLSVTGDMDGGSTAWSNNARSRWSLARPKAEDGAAADTDERILTRRKANYAAIGDTIKLRWTDGALLLIGRPGPIAALARSADADEAFLRLLARCPAQGMFVSHSKNAGSFAPKVFSKRSDREGFVAKDFEAAMHRLFTTQRIKLQGYKAANRKWRERIALAEPTAPTTEKSAEP